MRFLNISVLLITLYQLTPLNINLKFFLKIIKSIDEIFSKVNIKDEKEDRWINCQYDCPVKRYIAAWDGFNEYRNKVPAGIYFYNLETDGNKITKKMILIR